MIIGIIGTLITSLLLYLVREVRRLVHLIERHEKVLFGDSDIQEWEGLVKICISNRKYAIDDRRAFIYLVSILCKNNIITMDDELMEALDKLKRDYP